MRKITILSFILLVGSFILSSCTEKLTTISGTIDKNAKVLFSNVNVDICYEAFLDTMVTNDKGEFQLNFKIDKERFVMIVFPDSDRYFGVVSDSRGDVCWSVGFLGCNGHVVSDGHTASHHRLVPQAGNGSTAAPGCQ